MIQLTDLEKSVRNGLQKVWLLNQINLQIEEGEFVTIMGPSGAGKTTLLNILGMLDSTGAHDGYKFWANPFINSMSAAATTCTSNTWALFFRLITSSTT